jgi:hypothetical protein
MIGSLSDSVSVNSISSLPANLISSNVFAYNSGYVNAETIEPGKGYWVKTNGSGKIILRTSTVKAKSTSGLISKHHTQKLPKQTLVRGHRQ